MRFSRRDRVLAAGAAVVVLAAAAVWLLWPESDDGPVRERRYRDATACLLTDDRGLTGEPAATVWAGMQEASTADLVQIQYLSVAGPQTAANALTYVNTLASQDCAVFIAVGEIPVTAMAEGRSNFPAARYVAVAHDPGDPTITRVDDAPAEDTREAIREIVSAAD
ncbi:hypothetical protein O7627_22660 [Solwaraspora sp. WMMD1047]|uniref:hypothetical protein n=1 Tax=Solwaraspora sp. WMMD1047 TaxID=3016102 RepID=UPI002417A632|nr:hypothetical protein [Solwaraspora sp. WMMD1047]MDG4832087.1 hypothetical protein [Solwaraspora sp. WMMD1047]